MPPKKKAGRPKKSAVESTPQRAGRSAGRAAPDTITNKRGTEIETTAAARRPTRAAQQTDHSFPSTEVMRRPAARLVPSSKRLNDLAMLNRADNGQRFVVAQLQRRRLRQHLRRRLLLRLASVDVVARRRMYVVVTYVSLCRSLVNS